MKPLYELERKKSKNSSVFHIWLQEFSEGILIGSILVFSLIALSAGASELTNALKIKVTASNGYTDETVVRYLNGATDGFDGNYDARKFFSTNANVPSLYTLTSQGEKLSINALPELTLDKAVVIYATSKSTGTFTLEAFEMGAFTENVAIVLEDLTDGRIFNYKLNSGFTFSINDPSDSTPRFKAYFSIAPKISVNLVPFNGSVWGTATLEKTGNTEWSFVILDSNGKFVTGKTGAGQKEIINNLSPGTYQVLTYHTLWTFKPVTFVINEITTGMASAPLRKPEILNLGGGSILIKEMKNAEVKIISPDGREINNSSLNSGDHQFSLSPGRSGIFLVIVEVEGRTYVEKMMIVK